MPPAFERRGFKRPMRRMLALGRTTTYTNFGLYLNRLPARLAAFNVCRAKEEGHLSSSALHPGLLQRRGLLFASMANANNKKRTIDAYFSKQPVKKPQASKPGVERGTRAACILRDTNRDACPAELAIHG